MCGKETKLGTPSCSHRQSRECSLPCLFRSLERSPIDCRLQKRNELQFCSSANLSSPGSLGTDPHRSGKAERETRNLERQTAPSGRGSVALELGKFRSEV